MILDTCALLWLSTGNRQLSPAVYARIKKAPVVYLSAISGFEIGMKAANGKLQLPVQPVIWLQEILQHHGIEVLPLTLSVCLHSTELPPIHRDPCDRLIIATALEKNLPVVTADAVFAEYGIDIVS